MGDPRTDQHAGGGRSPRPRRRSLVWIAGLVAAVALMSATAANRVGDSDNGTNRGGDGATDSRTSSAGQATLQQNERLPGEAAGATSTTNGDGDAGQPGGASDLIAVAGLHEKRLYAFSFPALLDAARRRDQKAMAPAATSPLVGSATAIAAVGSDIVIASTNVRTLVRLDARWKETKELSVAEALGSVRTDLFYGSIVPIDAGRVAVSVAFGSKVGVVIVDVLRFEVVRTKVFDDRFAGFPQMCRNDEGRLFLVTTGTMDVLDPTDLRRLATAREADWHPVGATCVGAHAWVSDGASPAGRIFTDTAEQVGDFAWEGDSSFYLVYDKQSGRVFGSDSAAGTVFSCPTAGGRCATSARLGRKPTDLLVHGDHLLVTLESDQALGILAIDGLAVEGVVGFPDLPRTLTLLPKG